MRSDLSTPVLQTSRIDAFRSKDFGYYSVKEISGIIGFHQDTVYEWIHSKGMPIRRSGKRGRISVYWPDFVKWWSEYSKL